MRGRQQLSCPLESVILDESHKVTHGVGFRRVSRRSVVKWLHSLRKWAAVSSPSSHYLHVGSLIISVMFRCQFICECTLWQVRVSAEIIRAAPPATTMTLYYKLFLTCWHVLIFCQWLFACYYAHCLMAVLTALQEIGRAGLVQYMADSWLSWLSGPLVHYLVYPGSTNLFADRINLLYILLILWSIFGP